MLWITGRPYSSSPLKNANLFICKFADERGADCVTRVAAADAEHRPTLSLGQSGAGVRFERLLLRLRAHANPFWPDGEEMGRPQVFGLRNAPQLRGRPPRPAGGQAGRQELAHNCSLCARTGRGIYLPNY